MSVDGIEHLGDPPAVLKLSDPWDLATSEDSEGLGLALVAVLRSRAGGKERLLARMNQPIEWKGRKIAYLVIERRQGSDTMAGLEAGRSIECNVVGGLGPRRGGSPAMGC
jgi:hypothetical protein